MQSRSRQPGPSDSSLLIRNCRVWTGTGLQEGSVLVENGRITSISRRIMVQADETIDGKGLAALPGMVDAHVHLRDMKLAYKEDFTTGTESAAAGGFTTVLDMPNTIPATDSPARLREKTRRAERMIVANVGFHAAFVPDRRIALEMGRIGAFSMKLYMPHPIYPFEIETDDEVEEGMRAAKAAGLIVTVHAEEPSLILRTDAEPDTFRRLAGERPPQAETSAVRRVLRLAGKTGCRVHFCHVTLPSSLVLIHEASRATSEVTPHHMLLSNERLASRDGWKAWLVPPLRSSRVRNKLLMSAASGLATMVSSDHAPHTLVEKSGPIEKCPPGVPGLETSLALGLTLVNKGVFSLKRLVQLFSVNPARVFGLHGKGKLSPGSDADIVLVDLKKPGFVKPDRFYSKAKYSPFEGMKTSGQVHSTIVGGKLAYQDGTVVLKPGNGGIVVRRSGASG